MNIFLSIHIYLSLKILITENHVIIKAYPGIEESLMCWSNYPIFHSILCWHLKLTVAFCICFLLLP